MKGLVIFSVLVVGAVWLGRGLVTASRQQSGVTAEERASAAAPERPVRVLSRASAGGPHPTTDQKRTHFISECADGCTQHGQTHSLCTRYCECVFSKMQYGRSADELDQFLLDHAGRDFQAPELQDLADSCFRWLR